MEHRVQSNLRRHFPSVLKLVWCDRSSGIVGVVSSPQTRRPSSRGSIPEGDKRFSSVQQRAGDSFVLS